MKLPRDLSGHDLARQLRKFGYEVQRQTGSHLAVAGYVEKPIDELLQDLFG